MVIASSLLRQRFSAGFSSLARSSLWKPAANKATLQPAFAIPAQNRPYCNDKKLVEVDMDEKTGVATVKMNSPPVNSLSLDLLRQLNSNLTSLQKGHDCRGVILTSANPGVFSAGIDILEMYKPEESRLREFWNELQEAWMHIYGFSLPIMAAINGHSPAGGCLLALACDYRVMTEGKFTIGLNETKLGIVAPFWFMDTIINTIGLRQSERALQLGTMFSSADAVKVGMVDEICPPEEVHDRCVKELKQWMKIQPAARQLSKYAIRSPFINKLAEKRAWDTDRFVEFTMKDSIQQSLGAYLKSLSKKK